MQKDEFQNLCCDHNSRMVVFVFICLEFRFSWSKTLRCRVCAVECDIETCQKTLNNCVAVSCVLQILLVFVSYFFSASTIEECNFDGTGLQCAGLFTCWKGYEGMVLCCFSWEV